MFADLPQGSVLVKASLGAQLDTSSAYPHQAEAATNCGSHYSSNRLPRVSLRQDHQLCTRDPPTGPRTNTSSGQLQTLSEIPKPQSGISKRRSYKAPDPAEANSTPCSQFLHSSSSTVVGVNPPSLPA